MNPQEAGTLRFPLPREYFARSNFYRAATFATQRQVNARFLLPPGFFVIVPCTYEPGVEDDFLLTVFSEKPLDIEYPRTPPRSVPFRSIPIHSVPFHSLLRRIILYIL